MKIMFCCGLDVSSSSVDLSSCCYLLWWPFCVVATFSFRYSDYTILSWYKAYMKTGYTTQNATPPLGCDLRSAAAQALSPEGSCYLPCCYRSSADMPHTRACARAYVQHAGVANRLVCTLRHMSVRELIRRTAGGPCLS